MQDPEGEIEERIARLGKSGNGQSPAPDSEDLDWLLFHTFPGSDMAPARLAELLPRFTRALEGGVAFDFELLYVRALELDAVIPDAARAALARAAVRRALAGGFDPADAIAAVRFALRVIPAGEFLPAFLEDPAQERFRFHLTADFTLDERSLRDYLALSYLRDGDRDADRILTRYPVPTAAAAALAVFLEEGACRRRLEAGFAAWADPDERDMLAHALAEKLPGIALGTGRAG